MNENENEEQYVYELDEVIDKGFGISQEKQSPANKPLSGECEMKPKSSIFKAGLNDNVL